MKLNITALLAITALSIAATSARAAHVYGGIIDTNGTSGLQAGDALSFVSTSNVVGAPTPGSVVTGSDQGIQAMSLVTIGEQSGLYVSTGISFTALSNGKNWTGSAYRAASPFAATGGSIQLVITGVIGPDGSTFSFWEEGIETDAWDIDMNMAHHGDGAWILTDTSLTVGDGVTPNPTGTNNTNPPLDPYGHLHGRSVSVDTPGDYTVTYILRDSTDTYADSAPFVVSYSATAVPEPGTIALVAGAGIGALVLRKRSRKSAKC